MSYHGIDKLRMDGASAEDNMRKLNAWLDSLSEKLNYNFTHVNEANFSEDMNSKITTLTAKVNDLSLAVKRLQARVEDLEGGE